MAWEINRTDELWQWFRSLDRATQVRVIEAVDMLAEIGPALGRPLVDTLKGTQVANLKELRPGSTGRSEVRILFAFDPWREAILLIGR